MIETPCPHCGRTLLVQASFREHGVSSRVNVTLLKGPEKPPLWPRFKAWLRSILAVALLLTLAGCASAPASNRRILAPWTWFRADPAAKVEANKAKADANTAAQATNAATIIKGASGYVWATGEALKAATNREPAVSVASDMNSRAAVLLPAPDVADVARFREIVAGLLSTNAATVATASAALHQKDAELARAQLVAEQLKAQNEQLRAAAAKDVADLAAKFQAEQATADKWRAHQAKTWLGRIFDVLGPLGLVAISVAVPAAAPLAGRAFGWMSRVMPASSVVTGVVDARGFNNVVAGVAAVREHLKSDPSLSSVAARADDLLTMERSPDDARLIESARRRVAARAV